MFTVFTVVSERAFPRNMSTETEAGPRWGSGHTGIGSTGPCGHAARGRPQPVTAGHGPSASVCPTLAPAQLRSPFPCRIARSRARTSRWALREWLQSTQADPAGTLGLTAPGDPSPASCVRRGLFCTGRRLACIHPCMLELLRAVPSRCRAGLARPRCGWCRERCRTGGCAGGLQPAPGSSGEAAGV